MNIYWGDLHNHCAISYGRGSLDNALRAARAQLDFCSIVGHATWHDIPEADDPGIHNIQKHLDAFDYLAQRWEQVKEMVEDANVPHQFVTFHGYEAHSMQYGDYVVLSPSKELPIVSGETPTDMVHKHAPLPVMAIQHHVAYTPGFRAIDWEAFSSDISPVVVVYSMHGCSMSDKRLESHDGRSHDVIASSHLRVLRSAEILYEGNDRRCR